MPRWTKEQEQAIYIRDGNVIVSAGAGSGKTAVLTERVYQMIKEGYGLDEFVVLTFTNAAAFEMRERIRNKLLNDEGLQELASEVDTSYIMTFDAFALSLVKKYHYLLELDQDISISDESLVKVQKYKELQTILDELYAHPTFAFQSFVKRFLLRDDRLLRDYILRIDQMIDLKIDEEAFFQNYLHDYFNIDKIKADLHELFLIVKSEIDDLIAATDDLENEIDHERIRNSFEPFGRIMNFNDLYNALLGYQFPRMPRGKNIEISDEDKILREKIKKQMKKIQEISLLGDEQTVIDNYLSTQDDAMLCLEITKKLRLRIKEFKKKKHIFTFNDIAKYALIVIDHPLVQEEFQKKIRAVMVDEYQDTSDIQDCFLSKLARNNLYMVGDIKQSIYRFRNANCQLFLEKYERYAKLDGGVKIDLNQNFRSRPEVIQDINHIFARIMHLHCGGANYLKDHIIIAGNKSYLEQGASSKNYHLDFNEYANEGDQDEYEARLVAEDIGRKVHHFPIFEKDSGVFHDANYRDFVILVDRKTKFDLYKRVFEEYHIPVSIEKDEDLTSSQAVIVLQNLLRVYYGIEQQVFDESFEHAYASVYRSFLYHGDDLELERIIKEKQLQNDELYQQIEVIVHKMHGHSLSAQIRCLLLDFDFEYRLLRIGNITLNEKKIEQLLSAVSAMEKIGYTMEDFLDYLTNLNSFSLELKSAFQDDGSNSVRIMSIHKSKGLEFPIVYYCGLAKAFNNPELQTLFMASKEYGLIVPTSQQGIPDTLYHFLIKRKERSEELSEKIRLLYVALTRAKEKMIVFYPQEKDSPLTLIQSQSLGDLFHFADLDPKLRHHVNLTDERQDVMSSSVNHISHVAPIVFKNHHFSFVMKEQKARPSLVATDVEQELLDFGQELHFLLEIIDWRNPDLDFIKDHHQREYMNRFLQSEIYKSHRNDRIYHEYAYYDDADGTRGIIDLLLVNDQETTIIDFKTKIIDEEKYHSQLEAYRRYIHKVFKRPCRTYLYSIIDGIALEIK